MHPSHYQLRKSSLYEPHRTSNQRGGGEGRVRSKEKRVGGLDYVNYGLSRNISHILLDPYFSQALGKATGWCEGCEQGHIANGKTDDGDGNFNSYEACVVLERDPQYISNDRRTNWHRFIDHLAEGKDAESFFAAL